MGTLDLSAGGTHVLSPLFRLLLPFSMTPPPTQQPTPLSSPAMRSEKLLRDALRKDERERQQLSSPTSLPSTPPTHRRRHSHAPTSTTGEDFTRGSSLFCSTMNSPRSPSPSPSSFSQGKELERDRDNSPVRRMSGYGVDLEGNNGPQSQYQRRHSQPHTHQQLQQQITPHQYHTRCASPNPGQSRRSSTSISPSPSPLHMRRRQEASPDTHNTSTPDRHVSAYPSKPQPLYGEPLQTTLNGQILRTRLERALTASGGSDGSSSRIIRRDDGNEVRDERGGWPWGSGSMVSSSFVSSSPSNSPPKSSQSQSHSRGNGGAEDYVPSPYKTATANSSPTPSGSGMHSKIPVRTQTQNTPRKKEGGLEMRRPTQGPAALAKKEPLRPLNLSSPSSQRHRDITVTQQSLQARLPTTPKNNADNHSLVSMESCSTETSESSASNLHSHSPHLPGSGYCACSSHSSLDGPIGDMYAHSLNHNKQHLHEHHPGDLVQPNPQSQSESNSPSPTTKRFNARKASTQCRAIQGYVSFASVEGLGEPPSLVGDEFDGDGFGESDGGRGDGGKGAIPFLPLGMWGAALGWKRFLGGGGVRIGIEGQQQGVVV